jgi:hypothetical protein
METTAEDRKPRPPEYIVIVNGTDYVVPDEKVTFEEAVKLAHPESIEDGTTFTVTFEKARAPKRQGSLTPGKHVLIKKRGTEFDVRITGRS